MNKSVLWSLPVIFLVFAFSACSRNAPASAGGTQLPTPANLNISVVGRLMTVTWDPVPNATGYIINVTSAGCATGNRIANTETRMATNHAGTTTRSAISPTPITAADGFITFTGETSFTMWLMANSPAPQHAHIPMPTSLTARIMAIGRGSYRNSEYSAPVTLNRAGFRPAD